MNQYKQINKETMLKTLEILGHKLYKTGIQYEIYLFGSGLGIFLLDKQYRMSLDKS